MRESNFGKGKEDIIEFTIYDASDNQLPQGESGELTRHISINIQNINEYFLSKDAGDGVDEYFIDVEKLLKEAGYTTIGTGKWHNNRDSYSRSFTHGSNTFLGGMSNHLKVPLHDFDPSGEYLKRNRRFEDKFSSVLFREATVDFLQNYNGDKPFFAFVSFTSPVLFMLSFVAD